MGNVGTRTGLDIKAVLADGQQEFRGKFALEIDRIALAVDLERHACRNVLANHADPRTVNRDVLLAQVTQAEDCRLQVTALDVSRRPTCRLARGRALQVVVRPLDFFRADQLQAIGLGFVEVAVRRDSAQDVLKLVAFSQIERLGRAAVPLHLAEVGHGRGKYGDGIDQVSIGAAIDPQLVLFGECGVVAVGLEAYRPDDLAVGEAHQRACLYV